jgi:hypothetical protein
MELEARTKDGSLMALISGNSALRYYAILEKSDKVEKENISINNKGVFSCFKVTYPGGISLTMLKGEIEILLGHGDYIKVIP